MAAAPVPHDRIYQDLHTNNPQLTASGILHPPCVAQRIKCDRRHPVASKINRQSRRTTCRICLEYTRLLLGVSTTAPNDPALARIQLLQGGADCFSPPRTWPNPGTPLPPWDGFLTPLCSTCQDDALNLCWNSTSNVRLLFTGVGSPAPGTFWQAETSLIRKSYRYPFSTCTCLHTAGVLPNSVVPFPGPMTSIISPGNPAGPGDSGPRTIHAPHHTNESFCIEHRDQVLTKLFQTRDRNDQWLRNIVKDRSSGRTVYASDALKQTRTTAPAPGGTGTGTIRACKCGNELNVPDPARPPLAYLCMGCEGFVVDFNIATGPWVFPAAGAAVLWAPNVNARYLKRLDKRWNSNPLRRRTYHI